MQNLDTIELLRQAVEAYLPNISEHERRSRALTFVRGCLAFAAYGAQPNAPPVGVDTRVHLRIEALILQARRSAIASTCEVLAQATMQLKEVAR